MIPVVFTIPDWIPLVGGQAITSFGALLLVAFLAAGRLFVDRLRASEPGARGWDLVVTAAVAGLLGAKALHLAVNGLLGLPTGLWRAGLDWLGGLAVGAGAVFWQARAQRLSMAAVAGAAAAPLALGYAIGRIGSFLVGSEYGLPTGLPWGVAFPSGAPPTTPANLMLFFDAETPAAAVRGDYVRVHPAQLYEAVGSLGIFWLLRAHRVLRSGSSADAWWLFGLFLALHGATRGAMELIRAKGDRILGPVTIDMVLAVVVAAVGVWLLRSPGDRREDERT